MSAPETTSEPELELAMVEQDDGNVEAARFRIGLAMVCTLLAEAADQHGGKLPTAVLHGIAGDIITGNERGLAFVGAHVGRMMRIRIVPSAEGAA
jgi:hypothetical protein